MSIIIVIIEWLHLLATVVWIGAMIILMLIIIPSAKNVLQNENTFNDFIKSIGKKITSLVNISIIILIITGIVLGILIESKSTDWFIILIIKHIIVFLMTAIHVCRIKAIAPRLERKGKEDPSSTSFIKLKKLQMNLVWVNLILGIIVLLLSVIL